MILPGHLIQKEFRMLFHADFPELIEGVFNFTKQSGCYKYKKEKSQYDHIPSVTEAINTSYHCLTCSAPSFPNVFEMFSSNPRPMLPRPMNKPNSCDSIKTIGGNANVVKKAVARPFALDHFFQVMQMKVAGW
jgi:hypothetical protein